MIFAAGTPGAQAGRCANGTYTVIAGDTCVKVYCGKSGLFTKYNGYTCTNARMQPGTVLCKPPANCR